MGGFGARWSRCSRRRATAPLLTRERVSPLFFLQLHVHPAVHDRVSAHRIFCLTARRLSQFRDGHPLSDLHPRDLAAVVFLGVAANTMPTCRAIAASWRRARRSPPHGATLTRRARDELRAAAAGDDVILVMLERYAPLWLAGLLGAGNHGGGHGERLADPGAVHDVHRGRVRVLRRAGAVRRGGPGADRHGCSSCC